MAKQTDQQLLVRNITHQLNTPLTVIKWDAELLLGKTIGELDAAQMECLEDIRSSVDRAILLTNNLVTMFHLSFNTPLENSSFAVDELIQNITDNLGRKFTSKKLEVTLDIKDGLQKIHGPMELWKRILESLLSNAVKYSSPDGVITVTIRHATASEAKAARLPAHQTGIYLSVMDTGIGIPTSEQKHIFRPFFRAINAQKHESIGDGLGLHVAQLSAQRLGGKLDFTSKEHVGTTFYLVAPLHHA